MLGTQQFGEVLTESPSLGQAQASQRLGVGKNHPARRVEQQHRVIDRAHRGGQPVALLLPLLTVGHDAA